MTPTQILKGRTYSRHDGSTRKVVDIKDDPAMPSGQSVLWVDLAPDGDAGSADLNIFTRNSDREVDDE